MTAAASILESVRSLAPIVREHPESIDRERCLPKPVVSGLVDSGVFRLLMPRSLGGDEVEPLTACRVFEEAATQDGAVGWCAMIGATNGYFGGLLPTAGAREVYADRDVVLAGTFRPAGVAVAVDGGYRVAGRFAALAATTSRSKTSSFLRTARCGSPTLLSSVDRCTACRPSPSSRHSSPASPWALLATRSRLSRSLRE
jgi:Acyl-CoA dehydrogenase, N-terminal domain